MGRPHVTAPARVTLAGLGAFLAIGSVLPVLPRYVTGPLGGSDLEAGIVFGAFAVAALVSRPLAGSLADRSGAGVVLVAGLAAAAVAGALLFVPLGIPGLIVARLVVGAAEGFTAIGGTVLAIELAPENRRGRAIGLFGLAFWIGLSLGAVIGEGLLRLGSYEAVWTFATLAPAAGLLLTPKLAVAAPVAGDRTSHPLLPPRAALGPGVLLGLGGYGYAAMTGFVVLHLDAEGTPAGGFVLTAFALTAVVVRVVAGDLPDQLGPRRGATAALSAQAAGLAVIALSSSLPPAIFGACLAGIGMALMFPSLALLVLERVEPAHRASAIGGFSSFLDLGVAISGPATGALAQAAGYDFAFGVAALLGGAAALSIGARRATRAGSPAPSPVLNRS